MNNKRTLKAELPEEGIAREVWNRLETGLKKTNNRLFNIQFFISNIAQYIGETFERDEKTEEALCMCASIIIAMGWELNSVMKQARVESIFTNYIMDAITDKQSDHDATKAKYEIALQMNWALLQDLARYIEDGNEKMKPIYDEAKQLRWVMRRIFYHED